MYRGTTLISALNKINSTLTSLKNNGSSPEHFSDPI